MVHVFCSHSYDITILFVHNIYPYILQVYKFVKLTELYYAGSHGMDIMGPTRKNNFGDGDANYTVKNDELVRGYPFVPLLDYEAFCCQLFLTSFFHLVA